MLEKRKCEICENEFEVQHWLKKRFCSKKCSAARENKGRFQKGHIWDKSTNQKRIKNIIKNHKGMLGKKHTDATKKKMSKSSKNPYNYKDGGYYGKIETKECEVCGESQKRILIHHKDGNRQNNKISNLLAVCDACHSKIHLPDGKIGKNMER